MPEAYVPCRCHLRSSDQHQGKRPHSTPRANFTGSCPRGCSGHGACRTLREIAAGALTGRRQSSEFGRNKMTGVEAPFEYDLWDADMNQACVCDPGFAGYACQERECPRGDDPLTNQRNHCGDRPCHNTVQQFELKPEGAHDLTFAFKDWKGRKQTLTLPLNTVDNAAGLVVEAEAATTLPGSDTIAGQLMYALRNDFPEDTLNRVEVRATGKIIAGVYTADEETMAAAHRYHITFVGLPGSQELIEMTGESAVPGSVAYVTAVDDNGEPYEQVGNTEELECSGRGACDKASGICKCFAGYFGAACDHQNALVM